MKVLLALFAAFFTSCALAAPLANYRVIDGDTISVPLSSVKGIPDRISLRLIKINAPELRGKCANEKLAAQAAKLYVQDRLARSKNTTVKFIGWDKYGGRVDAQITVDGKDLGEELIAGGYAVPYDGGKRVNVWCPN